MRFFHFCKLLILLMRCHQISNVAVCVELTEFLDNIFKMSIFRSKFNFFEILKANMVEHPKRLWPYNYFPDILILRGQIHENITREKIVRRRIAIWGVRSAQIKKLNKTDPHFLIGVCCTTFQSKHSWGLRSWSDGAQFFHA